MMQYFLFRDAFDKQTNENNLHHVIQNQPRKPIRANLNDEIRAAIEEGWKTNPVERPTMLEMLERFTAIYQSMKTEADIKEEKDRENGVLKPLQD